MAWREGTLTRAYELEALCDWITTKPSPDGAHVLVCAVKCHLAAARDAALGKKLDPQKRFRFFRDGPPGRHEFERIAGEVHNHESVNRERGKIVTTVRAASSEALRVNVRLRSFRNVVVLTTVLMVVLAFAVALMGFLRPTWLRLRFAPEESGNAVVVCPTGQSEPFTPSQAGLAVQGDTPQRDMTTWLPRRPSGTSRAHPNGTVCRWRLPRSSSRSAR